MNTISRRTLVQGAAWSAPVVAASAAVPALAATGATTTPSLDYGLFVSAQYNGGFVGYSGSNSNAGGGPTTPQAYFSASSRPESDLNWSDSTSKPTNSSSFVNGEGSFTPVTNGPTGTAGSYASTSGFWFSVPTTAPGTGTGYVSGSRAVLASGAKFTTVVSFTIPAGTYASYAGGHVKIAGNVWTSALTGSLAAQTSSATYLQNGTVAGSWSAAAPTNTKNSDGSYTFTGTITFTTTQALTLTQTGSKYYGQVIIMPSTVEMDPSYGWTNFSLTSSVTSAAITYSGTGVTSGTLSVPALTTVAKINK